jgi:hypothetical protein
MRNTEMARSQISIRVCVFFALTPCAVLAQNGGQADTVSSPAAHAKVHSAKPHGQADTVSSPALSVSVPVDADKLKAAEALLQNGKTLSWKAGSPLFDIGKAAYSTPTSTSTCTDATFSPALDRAVILHLVHWSVPDPKAPQVQSSIWYVYRHPRFSKSDTLVLADITGTGDPLIYGARHLVILNIDIPSATTTLQSTVTAPVTQGTSDFATDVGTLFSTLTGVAKAGAAAMAAESAAKPVFVAAICEDGTPQLPFSVQIGDAAASQASPVAAEGAPAAPAAAMAAAAKPADGKTSPTDATQTTAAGSVTCTGKGNTPPCTMGRTFTSKEHAYMDVSAGLSLPGVRDTSFTFSATGSSPGVSSPVTRHTDVYALIDLFPLGYLLPKESWVPHFNLGVPATSQSLHRPYAGLAENLTGWTHFQKTLSLPVAVNLFGGIVFLKTERLHGSPNSQSAFNSDLSWHWVRKAMFGIEVPISSVASKFTKSGGGSKSKTS